MSMRFLDQLDIKGKRLLIRVDYNVPLKNGVVQDDTRIKGSLETIRYALDKGAALVLCSHLGKAKGKPEPALSLKPAAQRLSELLGQEVKMAPDCVGPEAEKMAKALTPGEVLMLENLRFHEGETKNDPQFSADLAKMGEIFVNDAFGTAHRAHASMVGVTKYLPQCCAGFLLKKEWEYIGQALGAPERPYVAVSGGAKVSSKLSVLHRLLSKVDVLIIGGAMANTFLLAKGHLVGTSLVEQDLVGEAKKIMAEADKRGVELFLPVDVVLGKSIEDSQASGIADASAIPANAMVLDIGPKTRDLYAQAVSKAKTVMWNGPMGAFENPAFAEGSLAMARAVAALKEEATTIVGGGDTDALVHKAKLADNFSFISTGGGSFMEFLEGKELPAFTALQECGK